MLKGDLLPILILTQPHSVICHNILISCKQRLFVLTGCEGYRLCPVSPESAIDRAACPGGVVGVGKQMF